MPLHAAFSLSKNSLLKVKIFSSVFKSSLVTKHLNFVYISRRNLRFWTITKSRCVSRLNIKYKMWNTKNKKETKHEMKNLSDWELFAHHSVTRATLGNILKYLDGRSWRETCWKLSIYIPFIDTVTVIFPSSWKWTINGEEYIEQQTASGDEITHRVHDFHGCLSRFHFEEVDRPWQRSYKRRSLRSQRTPTSYANDRANCSLVI